MGTARSMRAAAAIAPSAMEALRAADAHLVHPATGHARQAREGPMVVAAGSGATITLADGRTAIDGMAGLWCVVAGYGRGELADAAAAQIRTLAYASTFAGGASPPALELAERLVGLAPRGLTGVMFTTGGSEANDTAFKLARYYWRLRGRPSKTIVLSHDRGYHGVTIGSTAATGLAAYHTDFGPLAPDFERIPTPYCYRCSAGVPCDPASCEVDTARALASTIERSGPDRVAAVIVEPVLGAGGVIPPPAGYLRALRDVCDRYEVLLIADEVITAFGRTGRHFAVDHEGVVPDMITFAKGITSGYVPLGGVMLHARMWDALHEVPGDPPLMHGYTFSGHPVACAVALANLRILESEGLVEGVPAKARRLAASLARLRDLPEVGDVRGFGLLGGVELVAAPDGTPWPASVRRAASVVTAARERGLLVRALQGDILAIAPPFVITDEQIDTVGDLLAEAIVVSRPTAAPAVVGARGR